MHKYLVELIGTFFLVLVVALTGNPLAIGLVLAAMVYMWGHISGAHYNPAVSLAAWMTKHLPGRTLFFYWIAQFIWALLAGLLALRISDRSIAPSLGGDINALQGMVVEIVFTFAFVLVILSVAMSKHTKGNSFYGIAIWCALLAAAYAGWPISGGAFNPAVGTILTLVDIYNSGEISAHIWIYIVGPVLGAILASLAFTKIENGK